MKPSLRRFREAYGIGQKKIVGRLQKAYDRADEATQFTIRGMADSYQTAKRFQGDRALVKWWDRFVKGHTTEETLKIIDEGARTGQITRDQRKLLYEFLSQQGYIELDGSEDL